MAIVRNVANGTQSQEEATHPTPTTACKPLPLKRAYLHPRPHEHLFFGFIRPTLKIHPLCFIFVLQC